MNELNGIKNVLNLVTRLQSLCEGFDDTNKSAIITSRFKILLELSEKQNVSPNVLKINIGLAKSNLAILCNSLVKDGLIQKTKDEFDSRSIFYNITESGSQFLNSVLAQMKKNFEGELAYKNNLRQINSSVEDLLDLVK